MPALPPHAFPLGSALEALFAAYDSEEEEAETSLSAMGLFQKIKEEAHSWGLRGLNT